MPSIALSAGIAITTTTIIITKVFEIMELLNSIRNRRRYKIKTTSVSTYVYS